MSQYDLQTIISQAKGAIDLDPTDEFVANAPLRAVDRHLELHAHNATAKRTFVVPKQSAPLVSMRNVTGTIEDLHLIGTKDPTASYYHPHEGHAGYWLMGCHDLTISGSVLHVPGDFFYLGATKAGNKAKGTQVITPCSGIVLDVVCRDAGRNAIAAVGVDSRPAGIAGLTILSSCVFADWHLGKQPIDYEFMGGWHTKRRDVVDRGATWIHRT